MGCSSSRNQVVQDASNSSSSEQYNKAKEKYERNHKEALSLLISADFSEDIRLSEDIRQGSLSRLDKLAKKYHSKVSKKLSSNEELKNLFCELIGETHIKKHFLIPSIDLFKTVKSIYSNMNLNEDELKGCKSALEPFEKEFEMDLQGIVYDINNEIHTLAQIQFKGINSTLKFNNEYQPNILTIMLNQEFFIKQDVAFDVAELIQKTKTIKIVILLLNPLDENGNLIENFGFDGAYYKTLYKLFEGIAENRSIKGLFFHSMKNYRTMIAPEISELIIKKMQSETLLALHFGNINFSATFYQKMLFQIISTRSLLFWSLHGDSIDKVLNTGILNAVTRNNSLLALSFTGLQSADEEIVNKFKKEVKEKVQHIKIVYCAEKSFITLPFKYEKNK